MSISFTCEIHVTKGPMHFLLRHVQNVCPLVFHKHLSDIDRTFLETIPNVYHCTNFRLRVKRRNYLLVLYRHLFFHSFFSFDSHFLDEKSFFFLILNTLLPIECKFDTDTIRSFTGVIFRIDSSQRHSLKFI